MSLVYYIEFKDRRDGSPPASSFCGEGYEFGRFSERVFYNKKGKSNGLLFQPNVNGEYKTEEDALHDALNLLRKKGLGARCTGAEPGQDPLEKKS